MRKNAKQRGGFTLVEVLIVVVIMAILAATIIPQFSDTSQDAKVSSAKFSLHTLRSQIEIYRTQHDGKLPSADLSELTKKTDKAGATYNSETSTSGPYGPYIREIPVNPLTNSAEVGALADPAAVVAGKGWLYSATSGDVRINHADYLDE